VGRAFAENRILPVAQAFQQATEWHLKRPKMAMG
jgi:Asp-tRNA(Asn)/Glu-tRNA(Gln) amidotransferase A subunit family amidase